MTLRFNPALGRRDTTVILMLRWERAGIWGQGGRVLALLSCVNHGVGTPEDFLQAGGGGDLATEP